MGRIGVTELLLILGIALLLFGPSKLADMGKGLGEGLKNFKKGISQGDEPEGDSKPPPPPASPEAPKALAAAAPAADAQPIVAEPAATIAAAAAPAKTES